MISYNSLGLIESLLETVPIIGEVQSKFDSTRVVNWLFDYFYISITSSIIYLILLYIGIKWMENKPAYKLRRPLLMWNTGLAVFSFFGSISLLPQLLHGVIKYGFHFSVCEANGLSDPHIALWSVLFVFSKVFEFVDTAFIVLRKSPLQFLHWYHHITVLIYSWYAISHSSTPIGHWFAAINFGVHTLMYSYYAMKSASLHIPSKVAQFITAIQILQMFLGLFITMTVFNKHIVQGLSCNVDHMVIYMGLVIYGSYTVLFLRFFYNRYILKQKHI